MDNGDESTILSRQMADAADKSASIPERRAGRTALVTRLLVGLLVSGDGKLFRRLEELQEDVLADPGLLRRDASTQPATTRKALRRLTIALVFRGQRRISDGIHRGRERSKGAVRWAARTLDRLTDNPLGRPVRRPIAARVRQWERQVDLLIKEGELEEEISKVLAEESMGVLVDKVVDLVTENPELDRLIAELIGQKSVGLATIVADNTRTLTATADDVADNMLRRLLRRAPRRALPPSPLEGKPQTMYTSRALVEGVDRDDG